MEKKKYIEKNVEACNSCVKVVFSPVERFVVSSKGNYKVIFLDPPFPYKFRENLIIKILNSRLILGNDILIIHYPKEEEMLDCIEGKKYKYVLLRKVFFGRSVVNFYRKTMKIVED